MSKSSHNEYAPEIPHACRFCEKATLLTGGQTALCTQKGVVSCDFSCKRFAYDPLKRIPKNPPVLPHLSKDDLVL